MSEIQLTQLVAAVDTNVPSGSLIIDPAGNTVTFYKYKGTLASADMLEITPESIRRKFKYSASRGSTLALKLQVDTDLSEILQPDVLPNEAFNKERLTDEILDGFKDHPHDHMVVQDKYRLVFIIENEEIPPVLQQYVDSGDLKIIRVAP